MRRDITNYSLLLVVCALFLAACPGPDVGEEMALFTIDLGGGENSRAIYPPGTADKDSPAISTLKFIATFTAGNAEQRTFTANSNGQITGSIAIGTYNVSVNIYDSSNALYAWGLTTYTVKSGSNTIPVEVHKALIIKFMDLSDDFNILSPIDSLTVSVTLSGFINDTDANNVYLGIVGSYPGIMISGSDADGNVTNGTMTFTIKIEYDGTTTLDSLWQLAFIVGNLPTNTDYTYARGTYGFLVRVLDGVNYSIPVTQENIERFNEYANTPAGLDKHYYLAEHIALDPPGSPVDSNWTPIGNDDNPFTGSFNGFGRIINGLTIFTTDEVYQGMFGYTAGTVKNLGLFDISIAGTTDNYGGVAGANRGVIENCFVTGVITGIDYVGGIAGRNISDGEAVPIIKNCYTTAKVSGSTWVGGIVGENMNNDGAAPIVENCYATGLVNGGDYVGGIVGQNDNGRVQNCVALNPDIESGSGTDYGRVAGVDVTFDGLFNNFGRDDMNHNDSPGTAWTDAIDGKDGANVVSADYSAETWWKDPDNWGTTNGAFAWDIKTVVKNTDGTTNYTGTWEWNDTTNLPILQGFNAAQSHTVP